MNTDIKNATSGDQAWTEVIYQADNYNLYTKAPVLGKSTRFCLCREGQEAEEVRQSFVVFRHKGTEEWLDDAPVGLIEAAVIGDDDEEVRPVEVINLGMDAADFLQVEGQGPTATVFTIDWRHGDVELEGARKTDEGYEVRKADLSDGRPLLCRLTPAEGGEPFTLELQIPFAGFNITDPEGRMVVGDLELSAAELSHYTYSFAGSNDDDRFAVSLDEIGQSYQYIWYEDGTLSVRNQRGKMEKVGELPAQGPLSALMMGAFNALVKHKDNRWRITVVKGSVPVEAIELDPVRLARYAFERLKGEGVDEDRLVAELLAKEEAQAFQWFWLKADDWSYEHLADLLGLDAGEQDQQKMMELALLYNRYDRFMQRLRRESLLQEAPAQADLPQIRNNKRKIALCLERLQRHSSGEELLWTIDSETRHEQLYFFRSFHSSFSSVTA